MNRLHRRTGQGTIEYIVIIVVVIALAVTLVNMLKDKSSAKINEISQNLSQ